MAPMSARSNGVEWVETAEEVIIEDSLSPVNNTSAVIPVLEPSETPIQRLLETVGHGDNPEADEGFYCKECVPLFQDQSDPANLNGPSFILDFPTTIGVPQRALLSIPYGLTIGRSSIPGAGVGVINHGPTVSPGMHFGPLEGDVTTRESAVESVFSWELYKGKAEYEYIDAARDSHSNWMRYVNCARNKDETNLLAVQYKGSILFHCCRTIQPGDELMVWPSSKLLSNFSNTWMQLWLMRLKVTENGSAATHQIFLCSDCRLSFTTEAFLQRHTQHFHSQPKEESTPPAAEVEEPYSPASNADGEALPTVLSDSADVVDSLTCTDCGKVFKQMPHLRRHKLCVHSNKRPYCCPHCRRSFSQASGLIRHQLVHRKKTVIKETVAVRDQIEKGESTAVRSELLNAAEPNEEEEGTQESGDLQEAVVANKPKPVARKADPPQRSCIDCGKTFASEGYLRKHRLTVHKGIRPYVCTVCQQCFGQYSDLNRHLRGHQKQKKRRKKINQDSEESTFSCTVCSLEFSSAESLQQHKSEAHPQERNQEDCQSQDPDFSPPKSVSETVKSNQTPPSQRPRRLGARSKVSAITKLIAPKRRAAASTDPNTSPDQTENSSPEPEEPPAKNGKFKKFKWFGCNRCKRTYNNQEDLKAHKCALKQHKCGQCGATFIKSGFLKRHEQTAHANNQSFTCERCDKVFTNSSNLKQHQKSNKCKKYHCTSELFSCTFCQFSFTMKSYLIKHIKRHHPVEYLSLQDSEILMEDEDEDRACICPNCGETFENGKALKSHACYQQVKVLYLCTDCGKGFTNHYGLKQHQRIHTGEKPYSCPHCTKSFSYAGQLNVHLRTHTGEKPYLCTHCGDSFRQSGDLKRHERKHTGVRPYSCPECCKSFSRPQSLKAHQMLHLGQRMFKCAQCGKSFSRNYHLRRHHQKMHL